MPGQTETVIAAGLQHLSGAAPDDYLVLQAVRDDWAGLVASDLTALARLYELYDAACAAVLGERPYEPFPDPLAGYRFVLAFSSSAWLRGARARPEAWRLLGQRHGDQMARIRRIIAMPDDRITDIPPLRMTGRRGDVAGRMLELYNWHSPYSGDTTSMMPEAAQLVFPLCRAFPEVGDHVLVTLLSTHPDAGTETAALIRFYLLERGQDDAGVMIALALDMLGFHAERDGFFHRNSAAILTAVLRDARDWPQPALASFAHRFLLYPLGMDHTDPAKAATEARRNIAATERTLASKDYKSHLGISAEAQRERDIGYLRRYQADLAQIEGDFPGWCAGHRRRAVQRIAVSATTRKALTSMAKALPDAEMFKALLAEAKLWLARPKSYAMPKPADNLFKDLGLKLLVIEELMYRQKVLLPVFDIHVFASEYEKREISVAGDGYEVIPEARQYFANLAIPDDLLARVTHLHQSSGVDRGPAFMAHLHPFWDPGAGDGVIKISDKAIRDLDLLPKLARISGLENSAPGPKLLKALKQRGVAILPEEVARDA